MGDTVQKRGYQEEEDNTADRPVERVYEAFLRYRRCVVRRHGARPKPSSCAVALERVAGEVVVVDSTVLVAADGTARAAAAVVVVAEESQGHIQGATVAAAATE